MKLVGDLATGTARLETQYSWGSDLDWATEKAKNLPPAEQRALVVSAAVSWSFVTNYWEDNFWEDGDHDASDAAAERVLEHAVAVAVHPNERLLGIGGTHDRLVIVTEGGVILAENESAWIAPPDETAEPTPVVQQALAFAVVRRLDLDPWSVDPVVTSVTPVWIEGLPVAHGEMPRFDRAVSAAKAGSVFNAVACEVSLQNRNGPERTYLMDALFQLGCPLPCTVTAPSIYELQTLLEAGDDSSVGHWVVADEDILTLFASLAEWRAEREEELQEEARWEQEQADAAAFLVAEAMAASASEAAAGAAFIARGFQPRLIRSYRDAELAARDWLRCAGHGDAQVTAEGADGGYDVVGAAVIAQVKAEMVLTGRPVIQQIAGIGAIERKQAMCFSLAGYTGEAKLWAARAGVELFQFDLQGVPTHIR